MSSVSVGDLVKSTKGRDMDTVYIVYAVDNDYAYCVNGKTRLLAKPKKKKSKHLLLLGVKAGELEKKFQMHEKVLDSEIKKTIDNLKIV